MSNREEKKAALLAETNILASTRDGIRPFKIRPLQTVDKPELADYSPASQQLRKLIPVYYYGVSPVILMLTIENGLLGEFLRRKQQKLTRPLTIHHRDETPRSLENNPVPGVIRPEYGKTWVLAQRMRKPLAVAFVPCKDEKELFPDKVQEPVIDSDGDLAMDDASTAAASTGNVMATIAE